jgi:enoyl-CoA hydratase/carnithine racemase
VEGFLLIALGTICEPQPMSSPDHSHPGDQTEQRRDHYGLPMVNPATQELVREKRGAVSILRLNRPEARNALTPGLIVDLGAAVVEAESDADIRVVVLTGTGDRAFCAGMDLRSFAEGEAGPVAGSEEAFAGFFRLIRGEVVVPVIGAANGTAVAGGLELLLGCDVVVSASVARFGLPEVKRGLFAAGGGTSIGTRIPLAIALEMALTGDLIDAARAHEIGLVNSVVASENVLSKAIEIADRIAANGPLGLAATKELVRLAITDQSLARTRQKEWQALVFNSEDAKEGARAFVEKRPPSWKGR